MDALATKILIWLFTVTGSSAIPDGTGTWSIEKKWDLSGAHPQLVMSTPISQVGCAPDKQLQLPVLLYGAMSLSGDNHFIRVFGDPTFSASNFVFNSPVVSCSELPPTGQLQLTMFAYSPSYAIVSTWPTVLEKKGWSDFFYRYAYAGGGFALILISLFLYFTSFVGEERKIALRVCLSALLLAVYHFGTISPAFGVSIPMVEIHRYSDRALALGFLAFFFAFFRAGMLHKTALFAHASFVVLGLLCNITAQTGDGIQLGTTLQFPTALMCFGSVIVKTGMNLWGRRNTRDVMLFFTAVILGSGMLSEMMVFIDGGGYSVLPFGLNAGFLFFGLLLNKKIEATYKERDYLRHNLELEVQKKTNELRSAQAELIQSAKLASLGTLSAGLAHEINNAVNYVNGALLPLERLVNRAAAPETDRHKIEKLFGVMKDGLNLTVEIIKSLRIYSGINQAKFNDVNVNEVVHSVLTILRNKLRDRIEVKSDIDSSAQIYGSIVGVSQIFMNLISNAIDAMPNGGVLYLNSRNEAGNVVTTFRDTGAGIPDEIQSRIFDPFFTTKEVGKGTGLGLYIVQKEVERHNGRIAVQSQSGSGTTFTLSIPSGHAGKKGAAA